MKTQSRSGALSCAFFVATTISSFGQGSIVPTTAPSVPIMKTLDQVEARTPLAGGTSALNINASGSYYLTGNVTISTTDHGITIAGVAKNVTIDLNGFTLARPGSGSSAGIFLNSGAADVTNVSRRGLKRGRDF
jgi:hypothetical protein